MWMIALAAAAATVSAQPAIMATAPPAPAGPDVVKVAKPPAGPGVAQLKAWGQANIAWDKDLPLGGDERSLFALRGGALTQTTEGYLRVWIRTEFTSPTGPVKGILVRSSQALREFDCDGRRVRNLARELHEQNNLQGQGLAEEDAARAWAPTRPQSVYETERAAVCALRQRPAATAQAQTQPKALAAIDPPPEPPPGDGAARTPEPPKAAGVDAIRAWFEANIVAGGDAVEGLSPTGVLALRPYTARRTPDGLVQVWQRFESFAPGTARSSQMQVEFDCASKRARLRTAWAYPFNNLQGDAQPSLSSSEWRPLADGSVQAKEQAMLCAALDRLPVLLPPPAAGAPSTPPPPPQPDSKAVEAWAKTYLQTPGLILVAASEEGVEYIAPAVTGPPGGVRGYKIRGEYVRPHPGPVLTRSMAEDKAVDCAAGKLKVTRLEAYPFNNLRGQGVRLDSDAWLEPRPGSLDAVEIGLLCGKPKSK